LHGCTSLLPTCMLVVICTLVLLAACLFSDCLFAACCLHYDGCCVPVSALCLSVCLSDCLCSIACVCLLPIYVFAYMQPFVCLLTVLLECLSAIVCLPADCMPVYLPCHLLSSRKVCSPVCRCLSARLLSTCLLSLILLSDCLSV